MKLSPLLYLSILCLLLQQENLSIVLFLIVYNYYQRFIATGSRTGTLNSIREAARNIFFGLATMANSIREGGYFHHLYEIF